MDAADAPADYLYTSAGELRSHRRLLARDDIGGAQVIYTWRSLEPTFGDYDFSAIEADLKLTDRLGKRLWVQVQDRFFAPGARNVPEYLLTDPQYGGGLAPQVEEGRTETYGWVARQWDPAVRARFQALLRALAERFDGRIEGINLPETAADVAPGMSTFECDAYFEGERANAAAARAAFSRSHVVQYVNFWPCEWENDRDYMGRFFAFAEAERIGVGGPDIVPWKDAQMANSYPFLHDSRGRLDVVAMAVQEPTLDYIDDATGRPFAREAFTEFARDHLGVDIIFWSVESPWLARR